MTDTIARLIYVGDPMCSWCWGFAPEIEALSDDMPVEVVVGGLRPGPMAQPLEERLAAFLRHHWEEIGERTGQPFAVGFLDRADGWVYDTEPAAIAVTQMREMAPDRALDYFTDVQMAFYGRGEDVTDFAVLVSLTEGYEIDSEAFAAALHTEEARTRAWEDFSLARNWGISGFPTVVGELDDGRLALLARGWSPAEEIRDRIRRVAEAAAG
jgi:putative protein-disulfide isomerase